MSQQISETISADREISDPTGPLTVQSKTRVVGLDTVRGFALLGILMLNIVDFGWPNEAYDRVTALYYTPASIGKIHEPAKPSDEKKNTDWKSLDDPKPDLKSAYPSGQLRVAAVSSDWDVTEWALANVFFANKMRTLFCIMFGAGMIYLTQRSINSGRRPVWLYYRRMFILLLIGSFHAYLIWHGDILFAYAATGLYLYPFRKYSSQTLMWISIAMFASFVSLLWVGAGVMHHVWVHGSALERQVLANSDQSLMTQKQDTKDLEVYQKVRSEARKTAVNQLSKFDQLILQGFLGLNRENRAQSPESLTKTIRIFGQGSYFGMVKERAGELIWMHVAMLTPLSLLFLGWLMILGMSLAKTGFFAGDWPLTTYQFWAFRLVPLGWIIEAALMLARQGLPSGSIFSLAILTPIHQAVIPMLSLGYASALILAIHGGYFTGFTNRLADVGRMALSNYLAQSVICTFIFYSYGLSLFGTIPRLGLVLIVLAVWALELWWSPKWLAKHTFGPVEWLWRSLTYRKLQPFRKD